MFRIPLVTKFGIGNMYYPKIVKVRIGGVLSFLTSVRRVILPSFFCLQIYYKSIHPLTIEHTQREYRPGCCNSWRKNVEMRCPDAALLGKLSAKYDTHLL